jgi:hypothetical protein
MQRGLVLSVQLNPEAADLRKLDPVCTTRRRYYRRYLDPMKIEVQKHAIAAKAL